MPHHPETDALDEAMWVRPGKDDLSFFGGQLIGVGKTASAIEEQDTITISDGVFFFGVHPPPPQKKIKLSKTAAIYRWDKMELEVGWSRRSKGSREKTSKVWETVHEASGPSVRFWKTARSVFEKAVRDEVMIVLGEEKKTH